MDSYTWKHQPVKTYIPNIFANTRWCFKVKSSTIGTDCRRESKESLQSLCINNENKIKQDSNLYLFNKFNFL